jgi:hypothetical protein
MESNLWHRVIADILAPPRHNHLHINSSLLISFNHPLTLSYHRVSAEGIFDEYKYKIGCGKEKPRNTAFSETQSLDIHQFWNVIIAAHNLMSLSTGAKPC